MLSRRPRNHIPATSNRIEKLRMHEARFRVIPEFERAAIRTGILPAGPMERPAVRVLRQPRGYDRYAGLHQSRAHLRGGWIWRIHMIGAAALPITESASCQHEQNRKNTGSRSIREHGSLL